MFAHVHHPSETAEHVRKERPVSLVNSKHFSHDPCTEIRVRRDSQPAAAVRFFDPLDERQLIQALNNGHAFHSWFGDFHAAGIDRFEQRGEIKRGPGIQLNVARSAGCRNFRMSEDGQIPLYCALTDHFVLLVRRQALETGDEFGQIIDCAEMPCAIKSHLRRAEYIRNRLDMKGRQVSGDHVGSRGAVMDLDRTVVLQNRGLGWIHFSAQ